jgi:hypothetical protein
MFPNDCGCTIRDCFGCESKPIGLAARQGKKRKPLSHFATISAEAGDLARGGVCIKTGYPCIGRRRGREVA